MAETPQNPPVEAASEFPQSRAEYEELLKYPIYPPAYNDPKQSIPTVESLQTEVDNAMIAAGYAERNGIKLERSYISLYTALQKRGIGLLDMAVDASDFKKANLGLRSVHSALLLADEMQVRKIANDGGSRMRDASFHVLKALCLRQLMQWSYGPDDEAVVNPECFTDSLFEKIDTYEVFIQDIIEDEDDLEDLFDLDRGENEDGDDDEDPIDYEMIRDVFEAIGEIMVDNGRDLKNKRLLRIGANAFTVALYVHESARLEEESEAEAGANLADWLETAKDEIKRIH